MELLSDKEFSYHRSLIFPRGAEGGTELENQIWMEEPARLWNR
jgi:hypothetical protein